VAALVWQNLQTSGLPEVSGNRKNPPGGNAVQVYCKGIMDHETAAAVTSLLGQEGIKVVLLKGLALNILFTARGDCVR
jgi:hypothetical protein